MVLKQKARDSAQRCGYRTSDTLDLSDFIIFSLLRLKKVDSAILEHIVDLFLDLDKSHLGVVTKQDLVMQGLLTTEVSPYSISTFEPSTDLEKGLAKAMNKQSGYGSTDDRVPPASMSLPENTRSSSGLGGKGNTQPITTISPVSAAPVVEKVATKPIAPKKNIYNVKKGSSFIFG